VSQKPACPTQSDNNGTGVLGKGTNFMRGLVAIPQTLPIPRHPGAKVLHSSANLSPQLFAPCAGLCREWKNPGLRKFLSQRRHRISQLISGHPVAFRAHNQEWPPTAAEKIQ